MNKRVSTCMLALCIVYLVVCYFLKWFYPEPFIMVITNPRLILIGNYIDAHEWAYFIASNFFSFVTYYIYTCACCRLKNLDKKQMIVVAGAVIGSYLVYTFYPDYAMSYSVSTMFLLPTIFGSNSKDVCVIYTIHFIAQSLLLGIRDFPIGIDKFNYLQFLALNFEMYIWLILMWVIQLQGDESIWDILHRHFSELVKKLSKKKSLPQSK